MGATTQNIKRDVQSKSSGSTAKKLPGLGQGQTVYRGSVPIGSPTIVTGPGGKVSAYSGGYTRELTTSEAQTLSQAGIITITREEKPSIQTVTPTVTGPTPLEQATQTSLLPQYRNLPPTSENIQFITKPYSRGGYTPDYTPLQPGSYSEQKLQELGAIPKGSSITEYMVQASLTPEGKAYYENVVFPEITRQRTIPKQAEEYITGLYTRPIGSERKARETSTLLSGYSLEYIYAKGLETFSFGQLNKPLQNVVAKRTAEDIYRVSIGHPEVTTGIAGMGLSAFRGALIEAPQSIVVSAPLAYAGGYAVGAVFKGITTLPTIAKITSGVSQTTKELFTVGAVGTALGLETSQFAYNYQTGNVKGMVEQSITAPLGFYGFYKGYVGPVKPTTPQFEVTKLYGTEERTSVIQGLKMDIKSAKTSTTELMAVYKPGYKEVPRLTEELIKPSKIPLRSSEMIIEQPKGYGLNIAQREIRPLTYTYKTAIKPKQEPYTFMEIGKLTTARQRVISGEFGTMGLRQIEETRYYQPTKLEMGETTKFLKLQPSEKQPFKEFEPFAEPRTRLRQQYKNAPDIETQINRGFVEKLQLGLKRKKAPKYVEEEGMIVSVKEMPKETLRGEGLRIIPKMVIGQRLNQEFRAFVGQKLIAKTQQREMFREFNIGQFSLRPTTTFIQTPQELRTFSQGLRQQQFLKEGYEFAIPEIIRPISPGIATPISPFLPSGGLFDYYEKRPIFREPKRKYKYAPSVLGIGFGIKELRKANKLFTGLEIRGI